MMGGVVCLMRGGGIDTREALTPISLWMGLDVFRCVEEHWDEWLWDGTLQRSRYCESVEGSVLGTEIHFQLAGECRP